VKARDFDVTLYDSGVHTLINSVVDPLVALQDQDGLEALTGYLTVFLAQPGSLGLVANAEALQEFVLHAQRAGVLDVTFQDESFSGGARNAVPASPPAAPAGLWLTDATGGVVNASSDLGLNCDRYELQRLDGGAWGTVAQGTPREDGVDYVHAPGAGTHEYRVVARIGFYAGFPGGSVEVVVS
jgi:hypothetical protein